MVSIGREIAIRSEEDLKSARNDLALPQELPERFEITIYHKDLMVMETWRVEKLRRDFDRLFDFVCERGYSVSKQNFPGGNFTRFQFWKQGSRRPDWRGM